MAAAQAFAAKSQADASLSAAAAAAALRSHTTSPAPISELQTKRMARRASVSSQQSASGGAGDVVLQRTGSSGSMSERTFRAASPGPIGRQASQPTPPPPLPSIPRAYAASPPPLPVKSIRRPASAEPPERVVSPSPKARARGMSLDRGPGVMPGQNKKVSAIRTSNLSDIPERQGSGGNRNSVNFSRPMSPDNVPPSSPLTPGRSRKTAPISGAQAGALAAAGLAGARPTGQSAATTLTPNNNQTGPKTSGTTQASGKNTGRTTTTVPSTRTQGSLVPASSTRPLSPTSPTTRPLSPTTRPLSPTAGKLNGTPRNQPYVEPTEQSGRTTPRMKNTLRGAQNGATVSAGSITNTSALNGMTQSQQSKGTLAPQDTTQPGARRASLSPNRSARFSTQPTLEAPRHEPPTRAMSPVKSALKHSPSPRGPSPAGPPPAWNNSGFAPSEGSDDIPTALDESVRLQPRRKSAARVSFDDEPMVLGSSVPVPTTDSPILLSSQNRDSTKKGWFGLGREKRRSSDTEETLAPRSALPSFSSVRGKRVVTDPVESMSSIIFVDNPQQAAEAFSAVTSNVPVPAPARLGETTATGLSFSEGFLRGPSAVPTTISGLGPEDRTARFSEETHAGTVLTGPKESETATEEAHISQGFTERPDQGHGRSIVDRMFGSEQPATEQESVPFIAIQPATPGIGMDNDTGGMFEEHDQSQSSSQANAHSVSVVGHQQVFEFDEPHALSGDETTPSAVGIAEPEPEAAAIQHDPHTPAVGHIAEGLRHQYGHIIEEAEGDSGSSVYDDAEEAMDGDGFGSINAIVKDPALTPAKTRTDIPVIQEENETKEEGISTPGPGEGWDKAQSYWASLSAGRKEQLEAEEQARADTSQQLPVAESSTKDVQATSTPKSAMKKTRVEGPVQAAPKASSQTSARSSDAPVSVKKSMHAAPVNDGPASPQRSSMRSSMRPSSPEVGSVQKQMRPVPPEKASSYQRSSARPAANNQSTMRSSMRAGQQPIKSALKSPVQSPVTKNFPTQSQPIGAALIKTRPVSAMSPTTSSNSVVTMNSTRQARSMSLDVPPMPAVRNIVPKPQLGRTASNGSDSSFKRARSVASEGGGYTMRRSMRGPPANANRKSQSTTVPTPGRFSVRSSSPGEKKPFSTSGAGGGLRTSMRASSESRRPTSPTRSILSFRKGSRSESNGPTKAPTKAPGRKGSRFAADSDDDDIRPKAFGSRFVDSSDEDEPAPLSSNFRPVRGIPRRVDEGDSTDLEESDDERRAPPVPKKTLSLATTANENTAARNTAANSSNVVSPVQTPEKPARRSFFGVLGRKKDRVQRDDMENARNAWPLPAPTNVISRPVTSDGSRKVRPSPMRRTTSADGAVYGRTGKKKKFPMLRRAFGLHD